QNYLRQKAHYEGRERVSIPPFSLFYDPTSTDPKEGLAIPDEADSYPPEAVIRLCAAVQERRRNTCIQYLDTFALGLTLTLQLGSTLPPQPPLPQGEHDSRDLVPVFEETRRLPVMFCTPGMLVHPASVAELIVTIASSESPLHEIKAGWNVNSRG